MRSLRLILWVTLPLFALDQLTKWATLHFIPLHGEIPIVPGLFSLVHATNTGAAFGMMQGWFWFHVAFGAAMAAAMLWTMTRPNSDAPTRFACALILSGIMGNITDRFVHGHVIDFLDFYVGEHHWPAFNVADSAIVVAVGIFVLGPFFHRAPKAGA